MSIESVMLPKHLILCWDGWIASLFFFCLQSFPASGSFLMSQLFTSGGQNIGALGSASSIRVFSNESALHIRWPKYWSFGFSISPSNEYSGLISFKQTGWISLQSKGLSGVFSNTTVQKHQIFSVQPTLWFNHHIHVSYNSLTSYLTSYFFST